MKKTVLAIPLLAERCVSLIRNHVIVALFVKLCFFLFRWSGLGLRPCAWDGVGGGRWEVGGGRWELSLWSRSRLASRSWSRTRLRAGPGMGGVYVVDMDYMRTFYLNLDWSGQGVAFQLVSFSL
jgi:hypothetical protein